jgi:hypothetical protein
MEHVVSGFEKAMCGKTPNTACTLAATPSESVTETEKPNGTGSLATSMLPEKAGAGNTPVTLRPLKPIPNGRKPAVTLYL